MKILELFAGSRSIGRQAELLGFQVFSSDINNFPGINYQVDILEFDLDKLPWVPDVVWASPPCTAFSVAALGHHWTGGKGAYIPRTPTAQLGIKIAKRTIDIINEIDPKYFFVENPRGVLRKMDFMDGIGERHTITYCQYGDNRMKPTDIWTNNPHFIPKKMCKNGDTCHEAAPRGSKTGTQGRKNPYERSKIPQELCREILLSCK